MNCQLTKCLALFLTSIIFFLTVKADGNGILQQSYNQKKTGLDYVTSSKRLGQRSPLAGHVQPTTFAISGIPAGAVIEKAFVWISTSGNGIPINISIQNPSAITSSFPMSMIGSGPDKCWGYAGSYGYRADVTSSITGNGNYVISGLPTGFPNDIDGATLMIIYSDLNASFEGHIIINDGVVIRNGGSSTQTLTGINANSSISSARAFVGIGDIQFNSTQLIMNGTDASNFPFNWWNYEERSTSLAEGQTSANFTVNSSGDCWNWIFMGIYYQTPVPCSNDTEPPTFTCPSPQNITLSVSCKLTVPDLTSGLTGSDNCGTVTFTQSPVAGTVLSSSHNQTHNVVITANDGNGNTTECTVVLTGKDETKPTFTCPSPQNITLSASCKLTVPDLVSNLTGSDNCGTVTFTQSPVAGTVLSSSHNQTHDVVITASDGNGNTTECTVVLTGKDEIKPIITCPSNITVNAATGQCSQVVNFTITSTDNCSGSVSVIVSSHSSGHNFPVGTTTVTSTATDAAGNSSTCSFTVTVEDKEAPTVTAPATVDLECSGDLPQGASGIAAFLSLSGASATDNCTAQANLQVSFSDGALAGSNCSGTITRTYTITDAAGNAATVNHVFTVSDNTIPVINTCPGNGTAFSRNTNSGLCTYKVSGSEFDATGSDNCSGVTMTYSITNEYSNSTVTGTASLSGVELSFGLNTIVWIATDACGNTSVTCTVKVNVEKITTVTKLTVEPPSQQYSDRITITATVTPYNCTGAGDIGGMVTFKIGSFVLGTAQVINGTAILTTDLLEDQLYDANVNDPMNPTSGPLKPGSKTVTAHFSGTDPDYIVMNPTAPLTVRCEDADITYNGQTYFTVSPNTNAGTVVLSNYVVDKDDTPAGARGDIRNATATFWNGSINGSVLGTANIPVGLVNTTNKQEGFVTTSFNDVLSNTDITNGGKVYEVWSGLNNYYCGAADTYTPVTLGLPGQDFVTGGGYIVFGNNSAGTYAGTNGKRMNFGFVMRWNSSGKNLQGRVNVVYRRMVNGVQRVFQIKSNAINSLVVENVNDAGAPATGINIKFRRATISTKANLKDITDPLNPIDYGGNHSLTLIGWESTTVTTGALDRISIQLAGSGSTGLLFSSNWSSGKTVYQTLNGGKIQVRNPASAAPGQRANTPELITATIQPLPFMVKALPNPTFNYFNLVVEGNNKEEVLINVYNANGSLIHQEKGMANRNYTFGNSWISGVYLVQVKQGKEVKTLKLVKQ